MELLQSQFTELRRQLAPQLCDAVRGAITAALPEDQLRSQRPSRVEKSQDLVDFSRMEIFRKLLELFLGFFFGVSVGFLVVFGMVLRDFLVGFSRFQWYLFGWVFSRSSSVLVGFPFFFGRLLMALFPFGEVFMDFLKYVFLVLR